MQKSGVANLPLHGGHAPRWLFQRMIKLSGSISEVIIDEYSSQELLRRLSNPFWFQAFSCVLGFDWHSSGTTTTTCGALKIALKKLNIGFEVAGGKGKASRKTPKELEKIGDKFNISDKKIEELVRYSKLSAKIDNSCLQDSYNLYQHNFFIDEKSDWAVIQQGMNKNNKYARRYHWLGEEIKDFLNEPQAAISCDKKEKKTLNMVAKESEETQKISVDLICDNPDHLRKYFLDKKTVQSSLGEIKTSQTTLTDFSTNNNLSLARHHPILKMDLSEREFDVLKKAWEIQPENYEELILLEGIGSKKIRALALISDLIYGQKASWEDPVKYSFTHGGKDGFPYPVDKEVYDNSINTLKDSIKSTELDKKNKLNALKRLEKFLN